jgi:uncharacterized protein YgbK (DUF1537 family)
MLLGCIADDLTGATDLSLMLSRAGLRTVQTTGLPPRDLDLDEIDAIVVALKSRTVPATDAVAQSLAALAALQALGAQRFYFKYCSTFDSTDEGNIGPVTMALMQALGTDFTVACPAFPAAGRSIYMGNLFVNGVPLAESSMKDHPLTPMRDSNLARVLTRQIDRSVGLVGFPDIEAGVEATRKALAREQGAGHAVAILDALTETHLMTIGQAIADLALVTAGSGVALGLPKAYLDAGLITKLQPAPTTISAPAGRGAILAGSCSAATRGQVEAAIAAGIPALRIDPLAVAEGKTTVASVLDWIGAQRQDTTPLVYSSDDPANVAAVQDKLGRDAAGEMIEHLLADVAVALVGSGVTRLIVAGGETSGAVVNAIGVKVLAIGPEISAGVPWTLSRSGPTIALALKSGNFGARDFFLMAWDRLA